MVHNNYVESKNMDINLENIIKYRNEYLKKNNICKKALELESYFKNIASKFSSIKKVKGRGLMLGIEFDFNVSELRSKLVYEHKIFTGSSSNKNLIRILPPLSIKKNHFDIFFNALNKSL